MWAPANSKYSATLFVHDPEAASVTAMTPATSPVSSGGSYVLSCTYNGTVAAVRKHPYSRIVLIKKSAGASPTFSDIVDTAACSIVVIEGATKTWNATFEMPNPSGTPEVYVALVGAADADSFKDSIRGFATRSSFVVQ